MFIRSIFVGGKSIFQNLQIPGVVVCLLIDIDERNKVYVRMTLFFHIFTPQKVEKPRFLCILAHKSENRAVYRT